MLETDILMGIHAHASPGLDRFFLLSHQMGTLLFLGPLVLVVALVLRLRGERRLAAVWLGAGFGTWFLQEGLKRAFDRARPDLWPRLFVVPAIADPGSYSFPSGHALASAALYPLLAYLLTRQAAPGARRLGFVLGGLTSLWIGFGRLYLGAHWPSDVLAGWALGAGLAFVAIRGMAPGPLAPPGGEA